MSTIERTVNENAVKIELKNVSKSFGEKVVLRDVNLTIEKGSLSPSSGKAEAEKARFCGSFPSWSRSLAGNCCSTVCLLPNRTKNLR